MPVPIPAPPRFSRVASPAAEVAPSEHDEIEYPERQWVAQSVWHGDAVRLAASALRHHFKGSGDVLVAMELSVYYERGNVQAWLKPDVLVVFGVADPEGSRSVFRVWAEGTAPHFVLEVASPSTAGKDAESKAQRYAAIGVREYWRLDPEGTMMRAPLEGYRARKGRYFPVESVKRPVGGEYLRSRVLGLDLRTERRGGATVLVIRDPRTGEEFADPVDASEQERRIETARADAAEERVRVLEKRLRDRTDRNRPHRRDA